MSSPEVPVRVRRFICRILVVLAALRVAGVAHAQPQFADPVSFGVMEIAALQEASGVAASRNNDSVFWTHNDAGGGARIFAINLQGEHLGNYDLAKITKVDYEDIAIGPGPVPGVSYIYLGDIGDNNSKRTSIQVYQIPEPAVYLRQATNPPTNDLKGFRRLNFTYPDGARNAETLMVDPLTGDLFIASKEAGISRVYTATKDQLDVGGDIELTFVVEIPFNVASGGDISPTGLEIVIRQENFAWLWTRDPGQSIADALSGDPIPIPVVGMPTEPNGEAIGFDSIGRGYFTLSEGADPQPFYYFDRTTPYPILPPATVVPAGDTWRYLDKGTDAGTAWRTNGFNDSSWKVGEAQFGYGDGDERTVVSYGSSSKNKYITTYFRRSFTVTDPAQPLSRLELRLLADDGAAAYLNGTPVALLNLPANPGYKTLALTEQADLEDTWFSFYIDPALLIPGVNTLAVEVHQNVANSPDLSFDAQLVAWPATQPVISGVSGAPGGGFQFTFSATGTSATVQVSTDLIHWSNLESVPVTDGTGGFTDAITTGQPRRYYRIQQ